MMLRWNLKRKRRKTKVRNQLPSVRETRRANTKKRRGRMTVMTKRWKPKRAAIQRVTLTNLRRKVQEQRKAKTRTATSIVITTKTQTMRKTKREGARFRIGLSVLHDMW